MSKTEKTEKAKAKGKGKSKTPTVPNVPTHSMRAYIRTRLLNGDSNAAIVAGILANDVPQTAMGNVPVATTSKDKARTHVNFYVRQLHREGVKLARDAE